MIQELVAELSEMRQTWPRVIPAAERRNTGVPAPEKAIQRVDSYIKWRPDSINQREEPKLRQVHPVY